MTAAAVEAGLKLCDGAVSASATMHVRCSRCDKGLPWQLVMSAFVFAVFCLQSFCACLYFKPQTAAAAVNKSATYRTSDAAGSSSSKRRGAAASCEFYKCTVDGNVLECPHELR